VTAGAMMDDQANELEPEVLSYMAFRNRQVLRAWRERCRAQQAQEYRGRQLKAKLKEQWGKLTRYGVVKQDAERQAQ
jgi:hypothetical protein